jgi:hypothetical protein
MGIARSATFHRIMPTPLIQIIDNAVAGAYHRGGSQCCFGVFPIAHEDAARRREGLTSLEQLRPSKSRKLGFLDYQSTDDSFFALFTRLRQNHIIP